MKTKLTWFDRMMLGMTFAEANLPKAAKEYAEGCRHVETKPRCRRQVELPSGHEEEGNAGTASI